jgi:glycyl-tRNA synthetase
MFVNFGRLLEYNGGKLPFAAAQIGPAYRNEIAPRSGLLRVREFTLAEIEHFVNPLDKSHEKFCIVKSVVLPFFPQQNQLGDKKLLHLNCEQAVATGLINNETLCYFLARTYLFLLKAGVHQDKIRFRQHLSNEMAHYAVGCWDAEIHTSYGWIEVAGHADRAAYDLSVHQHASSKNLQAFILFPDGPRDVELIVAEPNKGLLGKAFKTEAKKLFDYLELIKEDQRKLKELQDSIAAGPTPCAGLTITSEHIKFKTVKKKITGHNILPGVIEPSYGIGRIIYCLLEHAFYVRPDPPNTKPADAGKRVVLSLKPIVAPICCSILPLLNKPDLLEQSKLIENMLKRNRITTKLDTTAIAVGRRYARTDELGIPFGITVDYEGLKDNNGPLLPKDQQSVTLRERDSMEQVRVKVDELVHLVLDLMHENVSWADVKKKFPIVQRQADDEEEKK